MVRGITSTLVERLALIGIDITLTGNYPWIYLDTINGTKVTERFLANHGFTICFTTGSSKPAKFTDRREVFKLIRKYTL